eukprot:TRINITY_DN32169_c0_g1_i1.p2 TRINITY_DN32169_c0_g1~~TRINITY_DN32169_c0_g1_i1.p2  ORF type:complete len:383 (-),score=90.44 TRINITY_DN32169_c0_g1_i1:11-1159(-)
MAAVAFAGDDDDGATLALPGAGCPLLVAAGGGPSEDDGPTLALPGDLRVLPGADDGDDDGATLALPGAMATLMPPPDAVPAPRRRKLPWEMAPVGACDEDALKDPAPPPLPAVSTSSSSASPPVPPPNSPPPSRSTAGWEAAAASAAGCKRATEEKLAAPDAKRRGLEVSTRDKPKEEHIDHGAVLWEFSVADGFQAFEPECQGTVESQYQAFKSGSGSSEARVDWKGKVILVDFKAMRQRLEGSKRQRGVRRRSLRPPADSAAATAAEAAGVSRVAAVEAKPVPSPHPGGAAAVAASAAAGATPPAPKPIVWEFSVHGGFKAFDLDCQGHVEKQYQAFKTGRGSSVGRVPVGDRVILVDFANMKQNIEGSTRQRNLRRRDE